MLAGDVICGWYAGALAWCDAIPVIAEMGLENMAEWGLVRYSSACKYESTSSLGRRGSLGTECPVRPALKLPME